MLKLYTVEYQVKYIKQINEPLVATKQLAKA